MNDSWGNALSYEKFMGRWSILAAQKFLAWLSIPSGKIILDVVYQINPAGNYRVEWTADKNLVSGIYLYKIEAESLSGTGSYRAVMKMILMK